MGLLAGHTVFTGVEATTIRASFQGNPMKSYLSGYGTGGLFKFFGDLGKWNTLIDSGTDSATVLQCEVRAFGHTQRKGRSKKNWTSCSDKNENSRIKFRFWSSYFSVCDETYTCVCTSKCNTEICKTKCNGGVAFTFANEFCLFFLGKTVDKLTVHRYNNRAALNGL